MLKGVNNKLKKVDRRAHGKRPFPSDHNESEEKEAAAPSEDHLLFPVYSARSQQDMSAMVSVLSRVIGGNEHMVDHRQSHRLQMHGNPSITTDSGMAGHDQSQPLQDDQGN